MEAASPGKFIVFEGLDGSGQSTQADLLVKYLREQGRTVITGKEPTKDSEAGMEIADVLAKRVSIAAQPLQHLFAADRKAHVEKAIAPALAAGNIFVEDRYIMSSYAFGSMDCDLDWLMELNKDFPWPDLTFVLKVRAEVSMDRIAARGKPEEFFEKKEKLEKVALAYDELVKTLPNCIVLDGESPIEAVHAQVLQHVTELLK